MSHRHPHAERLRHLSLRVTKQRMAVLDVLERHPHSDATFIESAVRNSDGTISKQAVYDVLATLTDVGILRRVDVGGPAALYELHDGPEHHHAVCRICAAIFDIAPEGEPPSLAVPPSGFVTEEIDVIYRGTCLECSTGRAEPATESGRKTGNRTPD